MIDFKKKIIRGTATYKKNGATLEEPAEYYPHRKAVDWMPELREFLKTKGDWHSTPHGLYTQCADWYKATGKTFKCEDKHNKNLLAWLKHLEGKGLL